MIHTPNRLCRYHIDPSTGGISDGLPIDVETCVPVTTLEGRKEIWVPARGSGLWSISERIKLAWAVFTGRADALFWPKQ